MSQVFASFHRPCAGLAIAALLGLAGCGGGAGGSGSASPAPPVAVTPPPPPAQPARLHPVVLAGASTQNNGGDFADGNGTSARFSGITGLAADKAGNIYVADSGNCAVRKVTPAGVVTTLAGSGHCESWDDSTVPADGSGQQARFYQLGRIAVDAAGNLYVNDRGEIRKITSAGAVTTLAGSFKPANPALDGNGAAARFYWIEDLAVEPNGNLLVVDGTYDAGLALSPVTTTGGPNCPMPQGYTSLREVSPQGGVTTLPGSSAGCDSAKATPLTQATAIRFDQAGNLYLNHNGSLVKRAPDGAAAVIQDAPSQPSLAPSEIAPDDGGNLYYRAANQVFKLSPGGAQAVVIANHADAPIDVYPDLPLDNMSNLTWIGGHDFVVSVNNQIVKVTLK